MTPRAQALRALIERVEAAEGPLPDKTVAEALYWLDDCHQESWTGECGNFCWERVRETQDFYLRVGSDEEYRDERIKYFVPKLPDRSLDGALRLLPEGRMWSVCSATGGMGFYATLDKQCMAGPYKTAPLALLSAALRAHLSIEEGVQP